MLKKGTAAAINSPPDSNRLIPGLAMTNRTILSQKPLDIVGSKLAWPLPMKGILREFTLSPMMPNIAGNRVMAAAMAASTTRLAPMPMEMKMLKGTSNMPSRANTTVIPLNKTARVAVAPDRLMASIFSKP